MLATLISIAAFIFVIGVLVVIHEAGHFGMARALGAPVEVFSVGFGRRLWGVEKGGTDYRVSLVPLGGYVRIPGLGPDESDVVGSESEELELLPRWKRALILLAGPATNIIGAVFFIGIAYMMGVETPAFRSEPPVIGWIDPGSPAADVDLEVGDLIVAVNGADVSMWSELETSIVTSADNEVLLEVERQGRRHQVRMVPESVTRYGFGYSGLQPPVEPILVQVPVGSPASAAGLQAGDRVLAVNGEPVGQFYDLMRLISPHANETISITVLRGADELTLEAIPRGDENAGKIGVPLIPPTIVEHLGPVEAFVTASRECRRMTVETFRIIGRLLTRKTSIKQVSGPIGIAQISGEAARSGLDSLIWFMGLISLQLGIFNLLPIPILDGGHLTVIAFESAIRRDLSLKVKERILEVGFYALILLMVVVLFNDIVKILPNSVYNFFFGS
ncbi:MAG: RIP metalloprotease RseP [Thermoanaerobaculales bacterium]|jgi:regulator of sigma E protease|nr:RIP metalloprotease RseP [Thermoanaerobaculales bacterium]